MALRGRYEERTWAPDFSRSGRAGGAQTYRAFIPSEIADEDLALSSASATLAERAGTAIRDLNASPDDLVSLEGLARQLLRSEALASSRIEGLSLSHKQLAQAELDEGQGHHKAREIMGNVRAMERAVEIGAGASEWSVDHIAAIHTELAIVPPLDKIAGQIREEIGWIGGLAPPDADYVGPPHEHIHPLLTDLCRFMDRDDVPAVPQAAIAHSQFELIHPFGDGNGRVGRSLIHALFRRRGIAPRYVPPVSLVLGAHKDSYIAGLERYRDGQVAAWVDQFSRAAELAAGKAEGFSGDVLALQERWLERVGTVRKDAAVLTLVDLLPKYPVITAAVAEKEIGRSREATINGLERLAQAGALSRHRNQRRGDSWEAKELFALLDRFEAEVRLPAG